MLTKFISENKLAAFSTSWNKNHEFFVNTALIFTQEVVTLWKTMVLEGLGGQKFLINLLIYSNKLVNLQLTTVLVCGSSLPKSHKQGYLNFIRNPLRIGVNEFIFRTCNFTKN